MTDSGNTNRRQSRRGEDAQIEREVQKAVESLVALLLRAIDGKFRPGRGSFRLGPNGEDGNLLTVRQVASMLNIPAQTIYTWRYEGIGPPGFKVGRHLRFRREDIETWLAERRSESARM